MVKPGSGGSADLAKVLHGALEVQQQVSGGAQRLVRREVQEGSPQPPLDPLVQERECARALALTLALARVGHLQQGTERGGWGVRRSRAAQRLQRLGDSRGGKRKDRSAPGQRAQGAKTGTGRHAHRGTFHKNHLLILNLCDPVAFYSSQVPTRSVTRIFLACVHVRALSRGGIYTPWRTEVTRHRDRILLTGVTVINPWKLGNATLGRSRLGELHAFQRPPPGGREDERTWPDGRYVPEVIPSPSGSFLLT